MNKPISKHALRRAVTKVSAEGYIRFDEPIGTVIDRLWHELEKGSYNGARKKAAPRATARTAPAPRDPDLPELP